jgi:hypothetical protein
VNNQAVVAQNPDLQERHLTLPALGVGGRPETMFQVLCASLLIALLKLYGVAGTPIVK